MPKRTAAFAAILAGALAAPAAARTLDAAAPDGIVAALRDLGYRAELGQDSDGDPKIDTGIEGLNYTILFYGCTGNADCADIQFSAGFDLAKGTTEYRMNEWNLRFIIGKAFIDADGDPYLQMFLPGFRDVSRASFERILFRWGQGLADFKDHIDW